MDIGFFSEIQFTTKIPGWALQQVGDLDFAQLSHAPDSSKPWVYHYSVEVHRLLADRMESYYKVAYQVMNQDGTVACADIRLPFLQGEGGIDIHELSVLFEDKVYLPSVSDFRVFPKGDTNYSRILGRGHCVHAILPQIRVGSVVTRSHTETALLKARGGHYYSVWLPRWVESNHHRVIIIIPDEQVADSLSIYSKDIEFSDEHSLDGRRIQFDIPFTDKVFEEPGAKAIEDILPRLAVSTSKSWKTYGNWAGSMLSMAGPIDPESLPQSLRDCMEADAPKDKLIDWVRNNINYFSVDFAGTPFTPRNPQEVLHKGWGDCKDKSWLLKELLALINVPSAIALCNSSRNDAPEIPGNQFDHALIYLPEEGGTLIDPTQIYSLDPRSSTLFLHRHFLILQDEPFVFRPASTPALLRSIHTRVEVQLFCEGPHRVTKNCSGVATEKTMAAYLSNRDGFIEEERLQMCNLLNSDVSLSDLEVTQDGLQLKIAYVLKGMVGELTERYQQIRVNDMASNPVLGYYFAIPQRQCAALVEPMDLWFDVAFFGGMAREYGENVRTFGPFEYEYRRRTEAKQVIHTQRLKTIMAEVSAADMNSFRSEYLQTWAHYDEMFLRPQGFMGRLAQFFRLEKIDILIACVAVLILALIRMFATWK